MYLGIDIGGTTTRLAIFRSLDVPEFTVLARFATQQAYEQQMQALISAVPQSSVDELEGIGVSIGGRMAKDGRSVGVAPNLPDYVGKPFAHDLAQHFACPIRLAHDTVCGLLGEKRFGPIQQIERCAYLTLSTGTGAAFQLRKASTVLTVSIEIGHQLLDGNTRVCLCGQVGCLETYTGGRQLELRLGQPVEAIKDPQFWQTFSDKMALGLVNLVQLTRVEAVAISGAMVLHNDFLLPLLQQKVASLLVGAPLELMQAALGENAPIVGAVQLLTTPEESIIH